MSILKTCLIVNLQMGMWTGYRLDKTTTAKVTSEAGAAPDAARVNKHIVPKEALAEIATAQGKVRLHFYGKTVPWKENGDRLITKKAFTPFVDQFNELKNEVMAGVDKFIDGGGYDQARERAAFRMGELHNPDDYPDPEVLRKKFYVNLDVDSVPDAYDIRLNKDAEILQARVTKAVDNLWRKLAEPLKHFSDKMNSDEIFRDSTVNNLREVAALIPDLNFMNDENLLGIHEAITRELTAYDAKDLRKDPATRASVGATAQRILDQMRGMMGVGDGDSDDF